MEDVNHLVVTPFRDISQKATEALNNAGENQDMQKAAQKLVKEGERALKRIEPLCTKLHNEYGDNFLNALRENTEIATSRTQLNDLLWDFDDYTEEDEFDAEKYSELQALSRQAAPKVYDVLISMKLEAPMRRLVTELSPPSSPLPPPSYPIPPVPSSQSTRSSQSSPHPSITPRQFQSVSYATGELANYHDRQPSSDVASDATRPPPTAPPVQLPPRPPSANPWDHTVSTLLEEDVPVENGFTRRPAVVPRVNSNSPVQTTTSPTSAGHELHNFAARRPIPTSNSPTVANSERFANGRDEWQRNPSPQYTTQPAPSPTQHRPSTAALARQQFSDDPEQYGRAITSHSQDFPSPTHNLRHASQALSIESGSSAVDEQGRDDMVSPEMGGSRPRATSMAESIIDPYLAHVRMSDHSQQSSGRSTNPPVIPTQHIDSGLIVVERDVPPNARAPQLSQQDCSIGGSSSFYVCKGFCDGAKEVIVGGSGVKKSRKPVGFTGAATVARCTSCCYELDFQDIENDVSKLDVGNRKMCGIGYRLRFLQKSHVATKRVDDILYGCPFCVHMSRTIDASDATVFFNSKALFTHLARHPRPLPEVPGFVVVDQAEVPPELRNDYDLHFKHPPVEHPVLQHEEEISALPSGFSREPTRRMYGQRLLGDRTPALEMVTGGHVTGITWPAKYQGEWAFGWYDGAYASVPTDVLKLVAPPERDVKLGGTSNVRAKARWKFAHKDKDKDKEWLKFDKNEVITNIGWAYPEHWCWSGTNAKGKWGIFPQAFIDTNTVQELSAAGSDRANKVLDERNKTSHIIPRFSIRKAQGPPSIASSTRS